MALIYGIFLQKMHQVIKIACKIICENELCRYFVQYEGGNGGGGTNPEAREIICSDLET